MPRPLHAWNLLGVYVLVLICSMVFILLEVLVLTKKGIGDPNTAAWQPGVNTLEAPPNLADDQTAPRTQIKPDTKHPAGAEKSPNNQSDAVVIVLFAYMRGGSSHLGDVMVNHPDVFYNYEPGWNIYNSFISSIQRILPLHIAFDKQGHFRDMPNHERAFVVDQLTHIFNCDFDRMPAEALTTWSLRYDRSHRDFRGCLEKNGVQVDTAKYICQTPLNTQCQPNVDVALERSCDVFMKRSRDGIEDDVTGLPPIRHYNQCMKPVRDGAAICKPQFIKACRNFKYRSTKILRMDMTMFRDLLKRFPTMKVVHQLRDPRGIVLSRKLSTLMTLNDMVQEATFLCRKMARDIEERRKLSDEFPGVFLEIKYEDISQKPETVMEAMYKHTGLPKHSSVDNWLSKGKNTSAATSIAWRSRMNPEVKTKIDKVCESVYKMAGYEV